MTKASAATDTVSDATDMAVSNRSGFPEKYSESGLLKEAHAFVLSHIHFRCEAASGGH